MPVQTVFKRYELKYMLSPGQKQAILAAMAPYMTLDRFGRTTIRNLYFDTDTFLLARRSIERPVYKEKLRLRSYALAGTDSPVFVELKKKYDSVVYKRRCVLPQNLAMDWLLGHTPPPLDTQIGREIDYALAFYQTLRPRVFLSYEREAYAMADGTDFRITFDDTVLCRQEQLSLCAEPWGAALLPPDRVLMEIKCSGGIPLWMVEALSREKIYKTSYSKYGTAYQTMICPQLMQGRTWHIKEEAYHAGANF